MSSPDLASLRTPSLLLDEAKMIRNITRLEDRARVLDVPLRPHLKTVKSVDAAWAVTGGKPAPITVSTLREAEVFHDAGYTDILYAVGVAPSKLDRVQALRAKGCDLMVILDSASQAVAVAERGVPALIEIDSDGHRGGLSPDDPTLVEIAWILHGRNALRGVITHAGESYSVSGQVAHAAFAERERASCVAAATALRAQGLPCPVVSVGSTPTAHAAQNLSDVTELRAGVYVFFDLVMAGIGVCSVDDVAISVLTTVIGHQQPKKWILVDAGWMAMSQDRGTARQVVDQGYGLVCDIDGNPYADLILSGANQEHGVLSVRLGSQAHLPDLAVGTHLRILPNHACATAAQHAYYNVLPADGGLIRTWPRFEGW